MHNSKPQNQMCDWIQDLYFLLCKNLNSSSRLTHLILEVSLHFWLIWPTVRLVKGHACTSCILVRHGSYHKPNLFFRPFLELKLYLQYKKNFYIRSSSTTFTETTHFWLRAQLRIRIIKIYLLDSSRIVLIHMLSLALIK